MTTTSVAVSKFNFPGRWIVYGVLGAVVVGILAFATLKPIRVLPRIRLAPGFSFVDQDGRQVTSEDMRGAVALYTFTYTRCQTSHCHELLATLQAVDRQITDDLLQGVPFQIVVVSFDPEHDTPERLRTFAKSLNVDLKRWRFVTLPDPQRLRYVVGGGFEVYYEPTSDGTFRFDPAYILVDGWGIIRGEYRYETVMPNRERIVRHIRILLDEIHNSKGAAKVAYEAAHLFLCYAR